MDDQVPVLDLRGLNCPLPVLKTQRRLRDMIIGERVWVETTDPLAVIDIAHYCAERGHDLIQTESMTGGHRFLIAKGPDQ